MGIEEFTKTICNKLEMELKECVIKKESVVKNNGLILHGLQISKDESGISPTIYMENYFEEFEKGWCVEDIIEDILNCYMYASKEKPIDIELFDDFEKVKDRIVYRLINMEKNKEMLLTTPHIKFLDLAVVFYYLSDSESPSRYTILINETYVKLWKKTKEELFEYAVMNTPYLLKVSLRGMESVIHEMFSEEGTGIDEYKEESMIKETKKDEIMYVLSNAYGVYGAACVLYHQVLDKFANLVACDFYILPSSVHEVILIPKNETVQKERLKQMVKEVNETEVAMEDILSNNVYLYSQKSHNFSIA